MKNVKSSLSATSLDKAASIASIFANVTAAPPAVTTPAVEPEMILIRPVPPSVHPASPFHKNESFDFWN